MPQWLMVILEIVKLTIPALIVYLKVNALLKSYLNNHYNLRQMLRLQNKSMTVEDLKMAMMVTVQKEYEHNVTQQVYVSDNLWKIISLAKDDVLNTINTISDRIDQGEDAQLLRESLMVHLSSNAEKIIVEKAKLAIKKEIGLIL